jgi:hypothetical protein
LWIAALAACCLLLAGVATGCSTTQEKAARKEAEAKQFLEHRDARRAAKERRSR